MTADTWGFGHVMGKPGLQENQVKWDSQRERSDPIGLEVSSSVLLYPGTVPEFPACLSQGGC